VVTVLEHEFFSERDPRPASICEKGPIGRLSDLAIVETGKLSEVTQVMVARSYGYPALTIPWTRSFSSPITRWCSTSRRRTWRSSSTRRRNI